MPVLSLPSRLMVLTILILVVFGVGVVKGLLIGENRLNAYIEKQSQASAALAEKRQKVTLRFETEFHQRKKKQKVVTKAIQDEAQKLTDPPLSGRFRVLHDAAAAGQVPDAAAIPDAAPIAAPAATETITSNYESCRLNADQLQQLQHWVIEQEKLNETR